MDIARVQRRQSNYFSRTEALTCQHVYWCFRVPKKKKRTEADQCLSQLNHWSGECHASRRGSLVSELIICGLMLVLCLMDVLRASFLHRLFLTACNRKGCVWAPRCEIRLCNQEEATFWRRLLLLHRRCVSFCFLLGHFGPVTEESITVSSMSLCVVKCKRSEEKTSSADGFSLSPKEKRNKQVFTLVKTWASL